MDRRFAIASTAAAIAATLGTAWVAGRAPSKVPLPLAASLEQRSPPALVEHCRRAAELLYEVSWAAACFQINDENECTLPDPKAAQVNALLDTENARCLSAELQASTQR